MQRLGVKTLLLLSAFLLLPSALSAQQEMRTVTGSVTVEDTQQPLAGVHVGVKGTVIATVTDNRGYFSLRVPADAEMLVFTYLGYRTEEAPVSDQVDIMMAISPVGLEGITVTALGLRREKASLGYAVQDLMGEDITDVPDVNVVNTLHGNVAGVHVTNAGPVGGSARIVIRGANSVTGENQPVFIVDGVVLDNTSTTNGNSTDNAGYGGIDYGNAIQDIDPANIEAVSVLKGPAATALYGSRAANGAVVITTKSGRGAQATGLGVTANVSLTAETVLRLPDYQDEYGQGIFGEFNWVDGAGGGLWDFVDESWGPKLDGRPIDQFTGPQQPWVAHPDNVKNFFQTGYTMNSNVAVTRSSENSHVRLSLSNRQLRGTMPGTENGQISLAVKGGAMITDRLEAEASVNYIDANWDNRPGTGYDEDNPMQSFIWFGRQVDMEALRDYRCHGDEPTPCTLNAQYNWNYNYHNNPFWEQLVNWNADERDRVFGHINLSYQLTDWLTASARVGRDWYRHHRKRVIAPNSLDDQGAGSFGEETQYRSETNWDLILSASRHLMPDLTMDVTAGVNLRKNKYEASGVTVARLAAAPDIFTIDNAGVTPNPWDYVAEREVRSGYGALTLNYKGWLNLDLTGRNDWSSTLPDGDNSYFYPSASTAFLFTEALDLRSDILSSGKVRASWSRVGNDADPYQLAAVFNGQQLWGGIPLFAETNRIANPDLKPEETTAWEFGTDLGFFNERLGFVLTYYRHKTTDQIMPVEISRTSGFTEQLLNAGAVENNGWELLLRANPIRSTDGFNWDVTVNWSKNNSEVTELYVTEAGDSLRTLVLGTYWSLNVEARLGEPYGVLFANGYLRCGVGPTAEAYTDICAGQPDGTLILSASGRRQRDPVRRILGNYNPDWIGGIQNRFSYGPWELSVLLDGQKGGEIFSVTDWFGEYAGVLESTLEGREEDWCTPGVTVRGVLPDGSINGDGDNDVTVCPQSHFGDNYGTPEASIVDATYMKLRELRLTYEIPGRFVSFLGFNGANVSLIGRNLFLWSKAHNIDPETAFDASNVQGIEFGQVPSFRSYGLSITLW